MIQFNDSTCYSNAKNKPIVMLRIIQNSSVYDMIIWYDSQTIWAITVAGGTIIANNAAGNDHCTN